MKPYPKYKDSGVEWIGRMPDHWKMAKLKRLAKVKLSNIDKKSNEEDLPVELCNYVDVYYNDRITSDIEFMKATARKDQVDSLSLKRGDVIITKDSETADDIAVPAYVPSSLLGVVCGYHLAHIRPYEGYINGNYLFRAFGSHGIRDQFEISANGVTRFGIGKYAIDNSMFLLPPTQEQVIIATYLDHKTAQIDDLIAKKRRLIELLTEERAAVINQAVTKGLDPSVKMKDSGLEWIGEMTEGWGKMRLKWVVKEKLKYGANEYSELIDPNFPRYIRITDFDEDGLLREDTFKSLEPNIAKDYLLDEGDILFARSGATVGKTFQFKNYEGKACFAGYLIKVTPNETVINSDFLYFYTKSIAYENWKNSIFIQATIQNIGADKYQNLEVPLPAIEEQSKIINYLNQIISRFDQTIAKTKKQIELLQEYRTTLISEVVTGKIDVREEVAA
ncbi:MAG: restriction endonuclease subunit S [Deltaproteobacteria bacterium]|nr:restriction endonuclease subunit S [Deltaproteobacteria bacterium]